AKWKAPGRDRGLQSRPQRFPHTGKGNAFGKDRHKHKEIDLPHIDILKPEIRPGRTPSTQFWLLTVLSLNARTWSFSWLIMASNCPVNSACKSTPSGTAPRPPR